MDDRAGRHGLHVCRAKHAVRVVAADSRHAAVAHDGERIALVHGVDVDGGRRDVDELLVEHHHRDVRDVVERGDVDGLEALVRALARIEGARNDLHARDRDRPILLARTGVQRQLAARLEVCAYVARLRVEDAVRRGQQVPRSDLRDRAVAEDVQRGRQLARRCLLATDQILVIACCRIVDPRRRARKNESGCESREHDLSHRSPGRCEVHGPCHIRPLGKSGISPAKSRIVRGPWSPRDRIRFDDFGRKRTAAGADASREVVK